ncbi:MAG: hypothetical protein ACIAQZ_06850 [Sedimentisphaeraceae bacterium JB056]
MNITKICFLAVLVAICGGCSFSVSQDKDKDLSSQKAIKADALASYFDIAGSNGAAYLTKQSHSYIVDSLKMKASAVEPAGKYEMTFNGSSVSFSGTNGEKYWSTEMARLLAASFSISAGYETPKTLGYDKLEGSVRIQGILYNVYEKNKGESVFKLYSRISDGVINRLEIKEGNGAYSSFCYNAYYEPSLDNVVMHNIDIYEGAGDSIDTKLIYSVKYTKF